MKLFKKTYPAGRRPRFFSMNATVATEAAAKGYGNSRPQDRFYVMFVQSFVFLSVQYITLLLISAVTAAVVVSKFWLRRFGRCSHGRAAATLLKEANEWKRRLVLLFVFVCCIFLPLYICALWA